MIWTKVSKREKALSVKELKNCFFISGGFSFNFGFKYLLQLNQVWSSFETSSFVIYIFFPIYFTTVFWLLRDSPQFIEHWLGLMLLFIWFWFWLDLIIRNILKSASYEIFYFASSFHWPHNSSKWFSINPTWVSHC